VSIETDIRQGKAFHSPHQKLAVNLMYTHGWLCAQQAEMLKPFGLTLQQYNVLRILRGQHPQAVTVNAIIERMLDRMSNASRLVDKLVDKGFATRTTCPNDRRAVDVKITDSGLDLLSELDEHQAQWEQSLATLSDQEASQLSDLLDKLRQSP
jgi:DNA-binding MarR family transcriptional regulator